MIRPAYNKNNVPIVLASNDNYAEYLAVMITSIVIHSSLENNYDILVFSRDISDSNKHIITENNKFENISIRFIDITHALSPYANNLFTKDHFTIDTYSRFFIPIILSCYAKVLYFDVDMVVLCDVAELMSIDISGYHYAATIDHGFVSDVALIAYAQETLGLVHPEKYKQAGVLIVNNNKLISDNIFSELLTRLAEIKTPRFPDQCVMNSVCEDTILELEAGWDVLRPLWDSCREYRNMIGSIKAVHFCGAKPVTMERTGLMEYFWFYAQKSGCFDVLYSRHLRWLADTRAKLRRRYWRYSLLGILVFGSNPNVKRMRQECREKLKNII